MKPHTQLEAADLCPHGKECRYAQIPACTLASIKERCSIYRDRAAQATQVEEEPTPKPYDFDKWQGFCDK